MADDDEGFFEDEAGNVWTGLLRTLGWTLLVSLGYMFVVMAQSSGGTWTLSTPCGCRRGTAELVDPPPAQGGILVLGSAVFGAWQSTFLRPSSACSSSSPIVVGAI